MDKKEVYIIGIDEVGRGPIAGPVAVGAFCLEITNYELLITNGEEETGVRLKDSKKLTKIQREKWFTYLSEKKKAGECDFAVTMVSAEWIDKVGIVRAIQKALDTSLKKVTAQDGANFLRFTPEGPYASKNSHHPVPFFVYLDGGLKAPEEYTNQETIIKGDELHPVISFASIVAKVSRDAVMAKYAKEYPDYGFESHVGYGTSAHYKAIKKHGLTPLHRKTFLKNIKRSV